MKVFATVAVGVAAACGLCGVAGAQVRTLGPTAPYLVTGRSVSIPAVVGQNESAPREPAAIPEGSSLEGQVSPSARSTERH